MTGEELILEDRLHVIRIADEKYDLKHNAYIWKPVYDEYRRLGYRLKESHNETI